MIPSKRTLEPWCDEPEQEATAVNEALPVYHDMDDLAGSWSAEQVQEFFEATADFDRVDDALWR